MLPLPKLSTGTGLLPAANLFSSPGPSVGLPGLSTPPKKVYATAGLSDPFALEEPSGSSSGSKSVKAGSIEERRKAMQDRVSFRKSGRHAKLTFRSRNEAMRPKVYQL
jgi:hypothetical protein